MASNKELEAGLRAMAEDFQLPGGGRKKLARLIAVHLWWFDAAEGRGMSWQDMIRGLTAAGVTTRGGRPLSVGTLSSTVWRKRMEADAASKRPPHREPRGGPLLGEPDQKKRAEAKHLPLGRLLRTEAAARPRVEGRSETHGVLSKSTGRDASRMQSNKDVLAFMNRARSVRRKSDEN
ncbi:hypothetical protein [Bradyrhizobium manausense]|uniref:hypothetical protein n=1 Tax=Bradyrhizobium manausense TaxID=989370 RepID=UPI001BA5469C|nr:hypothetical protein [Bradyrhizobium manausense]MBR0724113.1 hypothetical protein [Bradyrhizobium manausense]